MRGGGKGRERRDIHSSAGSRVMLRGRKYLRESLERGWCPSGGGGSGPGQAEGHLVHLAEGHHRTRSGEGGGDFPKHSSVTASSFISTRLSR